MSFIENCHKCGQILVLGKGNDVTAWCPTCEDIKIISDLQALAIIKSDISNAYNHIQQIISKYEKSTLLGTLYTTREGCTHLDFFDSNTFLAYTELIKIVTETKYNGEKYCNFNDLDFQYLLQHAEELNIQKRVLLLHKHNWVKIIEVPRIDIPKYTCDYDVIKNLVAEENFNDNPTKSSYLLKFTSRWYPILQNNEKNNIITETTMYTSYTNKISSNKVLNEFWFCVILQTSLELGAGNPKILNIELPKLINTYIKFFEQLLKYLEVNVSIGKQYKTFSCQLFPIALDEFFSLLERVNINFEEFKKYFLNSADTYKALGIFLILKNEILIGPQTLYLFYNFLKSKYLFNDYLSKYSIDIGREFEKEVLNKLINIGLLTTQPNQPTKQLINIMDNQDKPSLEIDIIAYDTENIYVIDCKHILISTEFLNHQRESSIKKKLKDEIKKQNNRIAYIKANLDAFGFHTQGKIHNVIVTFNKETLNYFEGINIISIQEIEKIKTIN